MSSAIIEPYLASAGIDALQVTPVAVQAALRDLLDALGEVVAAQEDDAFYQYRVPMLSEDGSCSIVEELSPMPYDLTGILGGRSADTTRKLGLLNQLVDRAAGVTGADWLGIYQRRLNHEGMPVLVKLAYRGKPSRAEFPLTHEFAQNSTNSTVGLTGQASIIDDVEAHVLNGGGFYVCDAAMQSEACLPIFAPNGMLTGILDAEAAPKLFFTPQRLAVLVAACLMAPKLLPE